MPDRKAFFLFGAAFVALWMSEPRAASAFQSYFVNQEFRADTVAQFPKWTGMLARYNAEAHTLDQICGTQDYSPCRLKDWKDFLTRLQKAPLSAQAEAINGFVNAYPYIEDIVNWGVQDYWETPYEFQRKNGDCEDYAIAKYMSLRALGVSDDLMRITIVRDLHLGGIIHTILTLKLDDGVIMLDNQVTKTVPVLKVYHYVPVYSINEHHWWQYVIAQTS